MEQTSYFIETSALFKRYDGEKGSAIINRLIDQGVPCYISSASLPEVISSLRRLVDVERTLSREEFELVKAAFLGEIGNGTLHTLSLTSGIVLKSLDICSSKYVDPLGAIQLASALSLAGNVVFISMDPCLLQIAGQHGLKTLRPSEWG